jgi:hypothetical protein
MTIAAWNGYGPGWGDIETLLVMDWSWIPLPIINSVCKSDTKHFSRYPTNDNSGCYGTELLHLAHLEFNQQAVGSHPDWKCKLLKFHPIAVEFYFNIIYVDR